MQFDSQNHNNFMQQVNLKCILKIGKMIYLNALCNWGRMFVLSLGQELQNGNNLLELNIKVLTESNFKIYN